MTTAVLASGDRGDFLRVNDFARSTGWLHSPLLAYAKYGIVIFGALLVGGYLLARSQRDPLCMARALLAGVGVLIAVSINQPIVHAVAERRPYDQIKGVLVLATRSVDPSFPSDHAIMAGATAVGLLLVNRKLGLVAAVAGLLMAFARVYVGAHFPIDVLAGLAIGAVVALVVQLAAPALAGLIRRLECTALRPVLTTAE